MTDTPDQEWLDWLAATCPIDLGDDNHRAGWREVDYHDGRGTVRDLWWLHTCTLPNGQRRPQLGYLDISTGSRHVLHSEDPLHVEASVLCLQCQDHGWIRGGRWVPA